MKKYAATLLICLSLFAAIQTTSLSDEKQNNQKSTEALTECPKCDTPVQPEWNFCPMCGTPLKMQCPKCNRTFPPDHAFCPFDGAKLKPTGSKPDTDDNDKKPKATENDKEKNETDTPKKEQTARTRFEENIKDPVSTVENFIKAVRDGNRDFCHDVVLWATFSNFFQSVLEEHERLPVGRFKNGYLDDLFSEKPKSVASKWDIDLKDKIIETPGISMSENNAKITANIKDVKTGKIVLQIEFQLQRIENLWLIATISP